MTAAGEKALQHLSLVTVWKFRACWGARFGVWACRDPSEQQQPHQHWWNFQSFFLFGAPVALAASSQSSRLQRPKIWCLMIQCQSVPWNCLLLLCSSLSPPSMSFCSPGRWKPILLLKPAGYLSQKRHEQERGRDGFFLVLSSFIELDSSLGLCLGDLLAFELV